MYGILVVAFLAALLTAATTPAVRRWVEKRGVVDKPEARRVNKTDLPRAGGIAIYLGFLTAAVLTITVRHVNTGYHTWTSQIVGVLVACSFIAVTSLIDDFKDLSAKWQALALIAAALILYRFGVRIEGVTNPFGGALGAKYDARSWHALGPVLSLLLTVVWVFVVTKTVDAIDGVDGLAAGVCAIAAATLALMSTQLRTADGPTLALLSAAVMGACLGFLKHNYHPAKIIMGTIGAQVLGLALAAITILGAFKVAAAVSVLVPVFVLGVPIFDYVHVLTRRVLARAPLTKADKRHLHHRLLERRWNQKQVVWFIYSVAAAFCLIALVLFRFGRAQ